MNHKEPMAECEQPDLSSSKKSPILKSIGIIDKSLLKIEEEILYWGIIALAALVIGGVVKGPQGQKRSIP